MERLGPPEPGAEEAVRELLRHYREASAAEIETAGALLRKVAPSGEREIWLSGRPLTVNAERILAGAALLGGWAVVREPGAGVSAATFLWARPTLHSETRSGLDGLFSELRARAPRRRPTRWLERRLARLRLVWVEGPDEPLGRAGVEAELRKSGSGAAVLPFPGGEW